MGKHFGEFEQIVLFSVLRLGDGAYGLALGDAIEEQTGRRVSPGAIYTTLGRLEDRGVVASRVERERSEPGRRKKFYRLTPEGARQLKASYQTIRSAADGMMGRLDALAGTDG